MPGWPLCLEMSSEDLGTSWFRVQGFKAFRVQDSRLRVSRLLGSRLEGFSALRV